MAQKRGFNFSLARHYDKGVAVVVLVALLISLFQLAQSAADSKGRKNRYRDNVTNMRPAHEHTTPLPTEPYETALRNLHFPLTVRDAGNGVGLFVPQRRVWCVDCMYPIRADATECPFCHAAQPVETNLVVNPDTVDSEGKGIPDIWRIKYFGHPFAMVEDRSRAIDDADDDGFTNFQEFQAGTSPRDPKDHPDQAALLRFKEITTQPYPFVFTSATRMPDSSLRLTFNMKDSDRTYFVKMGEQIGKTGLVYSNCTQKSVRVVDAGGARNIDQYEVSLFRPADGKTFVLRNNEPRATMEQEIVLTLTIGAKTTEYRVPAGGLLDLDGQQYKAVVNLGVDGKPGSVVLENILTAKKTTVVIGSL